MYWRFGASYRRNSAAANKAAFNHVVKTGPPPGLIAFDGELAVGWCQLTPRAALPWLDRNWRTQRVDEVPVWSVSCFYVRKGYRRRGVTSRAARGGDHGCAQGASTCPRGVPPRRFAVAERDEHRLR